MRPGKLRLVEVIHTSPGVSVVPERKQLSDPGYPGKDAILLA